MGQMLLHAVEKLARSHDRTHFSCGASELDEWLTKYSWQNQKANNAITYVTTADRVAVAGYYALTVAAYEREDSPKSLAKTAPLQVPCILLARLAVDLAWQRSGVGAGLLLDALRRAVMLSESVGAAAVLVHARDDRARDFYMANGNFLESPVEPLHLLAPMTALKTILSSI